MTSGSERKACGVPFNTQGLQNSIHFSHEKCFSSDFTKIIYVKTVATPEGPKVKTKNRNELKKKTL